MYIYIHIPFCNHICSYCDFPKVLYEKKYIMNYLNMLRKEIISRYKDEVVKTIFIGGGTPTSLDYDELKELLNITNIFKKDYQYEFTIEANVESLDLSKLKLLKKMGVNRISLGVESFDDKIIKILNRKHNKLQIFNLIKEIKKIGIDNISIDLMYGITGDIEVVKRDIKEFLKLDIPHISCYSLIIEDHTLFGIRKREYINSNLEYDMYNYINKSLKEAGYCQYEISNYAKAGYQSLHNLNYWNNGSYYGFGLGAVSFIENFRINNTKNLSKYLSGSYEESSNYEDIDIRISNSLILGFRKLEGINVKEFNKKYNVDILSLYNIKELLNSGELELSDNYLKINPKYIYVSNDILVNFV